MAVCEKLGTVKKLLRESTSKTLKEEAVTAKPCAWNA